MNNRIRFIFTLLILLCKGFTVTAQQNVSGYVFDEEDKRPIPFANVLVMRGQEGTATDTNGFFTFKCDKSFDSVRVTSLGYYATTTPIKDSLVIYLTPKSTELGEFTVAPGENPAFAILDKVIANKTKNKMSSKQMAFKEYQKIRFDLNNFSDRMKKTFFFKPFDYLWETEAVDSNGVKYVPAYIVEKYIHHYSKDENTQKSIVEGFRQAGMAGPRLVEFVDDLYILPNLYENFITVFEKNFPSPIHDNYKLYYKYYLNDSVEINERKTYLITFKPKYVSQRAFVGILKVDSATAAVKDISMKFNVKANVNFVRSYLIRQSYSYTENQYWLVDTSSVVGDFTIAEGSENLTGFFGRKTSIFHDYELSPDFKAGLFEGPLEIEYSDLAEVRKDEYWNEARPSKLDTTDRKIFNVIDRLENDPKFIFRKNLLKSIATGNIPVGPVEIGDFYTFYTYNQVEFGRFKLAAKIREKSYRPYQIKAFGAYGLRDNRWKYGLSGYYKFKTRKKYQHFWLGLSYKNDIEQITRSYNLIPLDHSFSAIVQYKNDFTRTYVRRSTGYFAFQPVVGFTIKADYEHEVYETINLNKANFITHQYVNSSFGLTAKLSWKNTDLSPYYNDSKDINKRFSSVPDLYVEGRYGSLEFGSISEYYQLKATLQQFIRVGNLGYFKYRITGGKTWGNVPYVFLNLPYANQSLINDRLAFNLMNFMEFITDEYVAVFLAHHFDGWILDKIPLLKKLKWRSLVYAKGLFGRANKSNPYLLEMPLQTAYLEKPYYELGLGFENIFKFFRVDFIWRLTDAPSHQKHFWFMVKPSVQFTF